MEDLRFELARREHDRAVLAMRLAASADLTARLGPGHWSGNSRIQSIRERIDSPDLGALRRSTLFVVTHQQLAVASAVVSTFPPGFWKKTFWSEPGTAGLGVFNLVVHPEHQGRGVGRFAMAGVEGLARERGIHFVRLDAFALNPYSTGFYRHLGYDERATIDLRGCGLVLFERRVL